MSKKLTQKYVQSLQPKEEAYVVTDTECSGFYVKVGKRKKTYYLKYVDKDTRQRKHKIGEAGDVLTVTQARTLANRLKARLAEGESLIQEKPKDGLTLGEFINKHYTPWRLSNHKVGSYTLGMIKTHFGKLFYSRAIEDLKISEFYDWRNKRLELGRKAATINKNIVAINAALNWGVKHGYIEVNPIEKIEPLKEYDSDTKLRYLTDEERERLMTALDDREKKMRTERVNHNKWLKERGQSLMPLLDGEFVDYIKPMVLLSLHTGIRQGNLFALEWRDINFDSNTITLRAAVSKGGKTHRIPMNSIAAQLLTSWHKQSQNTESEALVFPSPKTGKQLNNVKKAWAAILKAAEIENFRWHDMRHDFASQLVMSGVDLNTVRELLCHASMEMTMRYAHLAPNVKQQAVELLSTKNNGDVKGKKRMAV